MKKTVCFCLALGLLAGGCYTQEARTKAENTLDNHSPVYFYLRDGSCIRTQPGQYSRIDRGYTIVGVMRNRAGLVSGATDHAFNGIVRDTDIDSSTQEKLDVGKTILAATVVVMILMFLLVQLKQPNDVFWESYPPTMNLPRMHAQ